MKLCDNTQYSYDDCAEITDINITHMDGTTATLDKEQVQYVLD